MMHHTGQRRTTFESPRNLRVVDTATPSHEKTRTELTERCETFVSRYERQRPTAREIAEEGGAEMYPPEELAKDEAYIARAEAEFKKEGALHHRPEEKRAQFAEAFLARYIEDERWLGESCAVFSTTRPDDVGNGVDMVLEWADTSNGETFSYVLGVDVTTGTSLTTLDKKAAAVENSIRGIKNGSNGLKYLSEVRYYRSPHTDEVRRLTFLPKVIMKVTPEQLSRAMEVVERRASLTKEEQGRWAVPLIEECLGQLHKQVLIAMIESCSKYRGFIPLLEREIQEDLLRELDGVETNIQYAAVTGQSVDLFDAYDAFIAYMQGPIDTVAVPQAYKDGVRVAEELIPVTARMYQTLIEQKKHFTASTPTARTR